MKPPVKPDIHGYHDYRKFLKDWLEYKRLSVPGFSLRTLSRDASIAVGYLPTVISGARTLSAKALARLAAPLGLSTKDRETLALMVDVADSGSQELRRAALEKLQRHPGYRQRNPAELEVYRYLARWHYVAIREMATLEGFRFDATWIRKRLRGRVSLAEVQEAMEFLTTNGYLERLPDGTARPTDKDTNCVGGVYRVALAQFHHEMLGLAADALTAVPVEERTVMGHTLSIGPREYDEVQKILQEALDKIAALEKRSAAKDRTLQVTVAAFPLTAKKENKS